MSVWPDAGLAVWSELERSPGRFALISGAGADETADLLAELRGTVPVHVGRLLTQAESRPSEAAIRGRLAGSSVLVGAEILFDPVLSLDPIRLLATLARVQPVIAVWPVDTEAQPLTFPPGVGGSRHTDHDLQGSLLLRTKTTIFADEAPFISERFS